MALSCLLAGTPYVHRPLGWFETLFHESSHAIAALATGGRADRLELSFDGSGLMWTAGGWGPVVSFAGYAGAICWGSLLYLVASAAPPAAARKVAFALAAACAAETVLWLSWDPVTLAIMAMAGGTFSLLLWKRAAGVARSALRMVGAYVLVSGIRSPTYILAAGGAHNDASALRDQLLFPEWFWVGAWCVMGLAATVIVYRVESRADRA